jgi:hypothetical protein
LTCCVTSATFRIVSHGRQTDEQTDVRVCDNDVSQAKRTYGRTVSDGKRTDGYRSLLCATKIKLRVPECNLGNELLKVVRVIDLLIEITR